MGFDKIVEDIYRKPAENAEPTIDREDLPKGPEEIQGKPEVEPELAEKKYSPIEILVNGIIDRLEDEGPFTTEEIDAAIADFAFYHEDILIAVEDELSKRGYQIADEEQD